MQKKRNKRLKALIQIMAGCLLFGLVIGGIVVGLICRHHYTTRLERLENAKMIFISKQDMTLCVIDYKGDTLFSTGMACGKNYGNKRKRGDMKTPEGVFQVSDIQKASHWSHDFGDGKGKIEGAYGPYFIRLKVPGHKGIGIHGTHDPASIGTRATEGCIRLRNDELERLLPLVTVPMTVVITPSAEDAMNND